MSIFNYLFGNKKEPRLEEYKTVSDNNIEFISDTPSLNPKDSKTERTQTAANEAFKDKLQLHLESVTKQSGYLILNKNQLGTTDNVEVARKSQGLIEEHLQVAQSKGVKTSIIKTLQNRLRHERLELSTSSMSSTGFTELLENHKAQHGLPSTLTLMDQLCESKIQKKKRYSPAAKWPSKNEGRFMHLIPQPSIPSPAPTATLENGTPSVLVNMMEPALEESISVGDKKVSNAEILITPKKEFAKRIESLPESERKKLAEYKANLDSFYKNKVYFAHRAGKRIILFTQPTGRYTENQYIAISLPQRLDPLKEVADRKNKKIGKAITVQQEPQKRRHSISSFIPEGLKSEECEEIVSHVKKSVGRIKPNIADIETIAEITSELPLDGFIAQNAFDASTDANYQHFQVFTDAPTHLIPCFNALAELKFATTYSNAQDEKQEICCYKIRPESFHGSIYKITATTHDAKTVQTLKAIQAHFEKNENNGSSLNLVGRKTKSGTYEYYFILRKSIAVHPHLQSHAVSLGITRPGWAEMMGIWISKSADIFNKISDDKYRDFLQTFAVEQKECHLFEQGVKESFRTIGDIEYNLLETHFGGLRSDAETSQMFHVVQLKHSRTPMDATNFALNVPSHLAPNITITAEMIKDEKLNLETLSKEIAYKMFLRRAHQKNYGVIAIDHNVLYELPEFKMIQQNLPLHRQEFLKTNQRQSFKSFLLTKYTNQPQVADLLRYISDVDVELLLENSTSVDINFHQAIMQRATYHLTQMCKNDPLINKLKLTDSQKKHVKEGEAPNIRFEEYSYGSTTLTQSKSKSSFEDFKKNQENVLLLGGNKFNSSSPHSLRSVKSTFVFNEFVKIANKHFSSSTFNLEEGLEKTVDLLLENYDFTSLDQIQKVCTTLKKRLNGSSLLDLTIPDHFFDLVENKLKTHLTAEPRPVNKKKKESYLLTDVSFNENQIPPEFRRDGKIVPCGFDPYTSITTTSCAETVSLSTPFVPVGKKIAIVMNGGQAPGVADVAIGALLVAGPQNTVHIFPHGNEGLLNGQSVVATLEDLPLLRSQGGFPGGTTRMPLITEKDKIRVQKNMQEFDAVIFIGGDGSYRSNKDLFLNAGVPVYFCIKTIDGDFQVEDIDTTLGFYTAIEGYGAMIEDRRRQAKQKNEIHFLQVGGRYAGYLAVGTSALLPQQARPNLAIYPEEIKEKGMTFKDVIHRLTKTAILRMALGKSHGVFVLAEGTIQELPEVKDLIQKIKEFKENNKNVRDEDLKESLRATLKNIPAKPGCFSLLETLEAFSDEDVKSLGKPDPIGRVPFAQIDSYAVFGRLVQKHIKLAQQKTNQPLLDDHRLELSAEELNRFKQASVPVMKGTKSNYDQRSLPAVKEDYNNGLLQGMTAASAALRGIKIDKQPSALIASSLGKKKPIAISTKVKPGGEYIDKNHRFVKLKDAHLEEDLLS